MTTTQKLDIVLRYLSTQKNQLGVPDIVHGISDKQTGLDNRSLLPILEKLESENLIEGFEIPKSTSVFGTKPNKRWKIKFDGTELIEKHGSYSEYKESLNRKEKKRWPIIVDAFSIIGVIAAIVFSVLSYRNDKRIDKIEDNIKSIKDSLRIIASSTKTNTITANSKK